MYYRNFLLFILFSFNLNAHTSLDIAPDFFLLKGENMKSLVQKTSVKSKKRYLAVDEVDLKRMSPEYIKLRDQILVIKTADELAVALDKLEKEYNSYPQDAKFFAANLLLLKPFRGIIYRLIPMAETSKASHSFLRNFVKDLAFNLKIYLPTDHWKAGFDYITAPFKNSDGSIVSQFKNESKIIRIGSGAVAQTQEEQLQDFLTLDVARKLLDVISVVSKMSFKNEPIIWDNQIVFGMDTFLNDGTAERFRYIGDDGRLAAMAGYYQGLRYIFFLGAYNLNGLMKLNVEIGKLYGFDGFDGEINGVPPLKVAQKINAMPNLFKLRGEKGKKYMEYSYKFLQQSVRFSYLAYQESLANGQEGKLAGFDARKLRPWEGQIDKQFEVIGRLTGMNEESLPGFEPISSPITGKVFSFNLSEFYMNPPADLKGFLPIVPKGWDREPAMVPAKNGMPSYPNYSWGQAQSWKVGEWSRYIKKVQAGSNTNLTDKDIPEFVRTMRQSYGGEMIGAPFAAFVK